jgi:hypothetical protein
MIDIGRLRLQLPAGYQGRADSIARLVAAELRGRLQGVAGGIDELRVGQVEIAAGANDRAVAQAVAASVADNAHRALRDG